MIIFVCFQLSRYWNKLFGDPVSRMMLPSVVRSIFIFCPLLKTDDRFRSIRNGALFNLILFTGAAILIYFFPFSWITLVLFGGHIGLEIYKYIQKKEEVDKFLAEQRESVDFVVGILEPIVKAHRLLCIYSVYLFALLFVVYAARP